MHFISSESLWTPTYYVPSGWIEHAPFAFWLMGAHKPFRLVELGTHHGFSYFTFNQAAKMLSLRVHCTAIDTWLGDQHAGFYSEEVFDRVKAHNAEHYFDQSDLLRSTFDEAVDKFADGSIDLLHIDGRHLYSDARNDFDHWRGKLSRRAIVLFHDTNVTAGEFGVYQLWQELRSQYPAFEFKHGHGLGVLCYGAEQTQIIKDLFEASRNEKEHMLISDLYARLGQQVNNQFLFRNSLENLNAREKIWQQNEETWKQSEESWKRDVEWLKTQLDTANEGKRQQSELHAAAAAQLEEARSRLLINDTAVKELEAKLCSAQLEATKESERLHEESIRERALVMKRFENQVDSLRRDNRTLKSEIAKLDGALKQLSADAQSLHSERDYYASEYLAAMASRSWRVTRPLRSLTSLLDARKGRKP